MKREINFLFKMKQVRNNLFKYLFENIRIQDNGYNFHFIYLLNRKVKEENKSFLFRGDTLRQKVINVVDDFILHCEELHNRDCISGFQITGGYFY